jgi:3-isopropylmalate/(R)-2-methylmalate dehydratase small subunit
VNCASAPGEGAREPGHGVFPFEIDKKIKHRLINGLDDVALTLQQAEVIDAFEASSGADRGPVTTEL